MPDRRDATSGSIRARDGADLHYLSWSPRDREPWAVLVYLHGIASHAGWFSETAADLVARGVAVYAPDRRGSGLSSGPRGHLPSYRRALDDIDDILTQVGSEQREAPVFVAASSWAAKLALVHAATRPERLSGLLMLGPGLLPRVELSVPRRLAVLVGHIVVPRAQVAIPLTPEQYTTNAPYLEFIRGDPLRLSTVTTQFFWQTARLDLLRRRTSARLSLPLLVLQGEEDAMMDVPGTQAWFAGLPAGDATYRSYAGAGHTLDFEPDRSEYLDDMIAWLSSHVPSRSSR